jgi:hypothetical protein
MTVIADLIISLPVHIFGIVKFIFPGLTVRERRIVMSFLIFSLMLIVLGSYLAYFKIVPLTVTRGSGSPAGSGRSSPLRPCVLERETWLVGYFGGDYTL